MSIEIIGTQIDATEQAPTVLGHEKIPTGGRGLYHVTVDQVRDYVLTYFGKEAIRLGEVDNTSDEDKPLSKASREALNKKVSKTDPYVSSLNGLTGDVDITATLIGLGNVDNTSDKDKPLSELAIRALADKLDKITFKDFKRVFEAFQKQVEIDIKALKLTDQEILSRLLNVETETDELRTSLELLTDYLNSQLQYYSTTLSDEQFELINQFMYQNIDNYLMSSSYLFNKFKTIEVKIQDSTKPFLGLIDELKLKDTAIEESFNQLVAQLNASLNAVKEDLLSIEIGIGSQVNILDRKLIEAQTYIEDQLALLKPMIEDAATNYLKDLADFQQTVNDVTNSLKDKIDETNNTVEDQNKTLDLLNGVLNSKHDELLDLIDASGKSYAELLLEATEASKKDMLDLAYQMTEISEGVKDRYDVLEGIFETQVEHSKLILNNRIDLLDQAISNTYIDLGNTLAQIEDIKNDALASAEHYNNRLDSMSDELIDQANNLISGLAQEVADRNSAINARAESILAEVDNRLQNLDLAAIEEINQKIDELNQKIEDGAGALTQEIIDYVAGKISASETVLTDHVNNLITNLTLADIDRLNVIGGLEDGLTQEILDRQTGDESILTEVRNYKSSNDAALANVQQTITTKVDEAIASSTVIDSLDARVQGVEATTGTLVTNLASVTNKVNVTATATEANTSAISALTTQVSNNDAEVKGLIATETQNRSTALGNITSQLDTLQSSYSNLNTAGRNLLQASNVPLLRNSGEYLMGLYEVGEVIEPNSEYTLIACITHTVPEGSTTPAEIRGWQDASVPILFGETIGAGKKIFTATFTSRAEGFTNVHFYYYPSNTPDGMAIVHWAVLVRGKALPLTDWIESPFDSEKRSTATNASITTLQQVVTDADSALSERINQNTSKINEQDLEISAVITETAQAFSNLEGSVASRFDALTADFNDTYNNTSALIAAETQSRVDADQAITNSISIFRSEFSGAGVNLLSSIFTDPVREQDYRFTDNVSILFVPPQTQFTTVQSKLSLIDKSYLGNLRYSQTGQHDSLVVSGGESYIVSAYVAADTQETPFRFSLELNDGTILNSPIFYISNSFERISTVFVMPENEAITSASLFSVLLPIPLDQPSGVLIDRIMVERKIGEGNTPSDWVSGSTRSSSVMAEQFYSLSNDTLALTQKVDTSLVAIEANDRVIKGLISSESLARAEKDEVLTNQINSLQASISDIAMGTDNLWWLTEPVQDVNYSTEYITPDLQHQKITVNGAPSGSVSFIWNDLFNSNKSPLFVRDEIYSLTFQVKTKATVIQVTSSIFGNGNPVSNKIVNVTPDEWFSVKLPGLVVNDELEFLASFSGVLNITLSTVLGLSIEQVQSTFEIRNILLQLGSSNSAYSKPSWIISDQVDRVDAALTEERTARVTADAAITESINALSATIVEGDRVIDSRITQELSTVANQFQTVAQTIEGLSSSFENISIGGANLVPYSYRFSLPAHNSASYNAELLPGDIIKLTTTVPGDTVMSYFTNFQSSDTNLATVLEPIANTTGIDVTVSFWIKAIDLNNLPSSTLLPQLYLSSEHSYIPFTGIRGDISKGGWVQYYCTRHLNVPLTSLQPHLHLSAATIGAGIIIGRWKVEVGNKPTDWSDYREIAKVVSEKLDASITQVNKTITDANTANANSFLALNSVLTDLPNSGINLLKQSYVAPDEDTVIQGSFGVLDLINLYPTTISGLSGYTFRTKTTDSSYVYFNESDNMALFTDLLPGKYLLSFWAKSETDGHVIGTALQRDNDNIITGKDITLTTNFVRYASTFTVTVEAKYAVKLFMNQSRIASRTIFIERLMLEQQYANSQTPSKWTEGFVSVPYSLLPVRASEAQLSTELNTLVNDQSSTASRVDTLTTELAETDSRISGQIVNLSESVTTLEGNVTTQMDTLKSEFEVRNTESSPNLWVYKDSVAVGNVVKTGEYSYTFTEFSSNSSGIYIPIIALAPTIKENDFITISYTLTFTSGTLMYLGGGIIGLQPLNMYANSIKLVPVNTTTYIHKVPTTVQHGTTIQVVSVLQRTSVAGNRIWIQPNYSNIGLTFSGIIKNVQIEKGQKVSPWSLALADQEEAFASTRALINNLQTTSANADQALAEDITTLEVSTANLNTKTDAMVTDFNRSITNLESATSESFQQVNANYNSLPNSGVNLLSGEVSNPTSNPGNYISGHDYGVVSSFETKAVNAWKVTTNNGDSSSGMYFNTGGGNTVSDTTLVLEPGTYILSGYIKATQNHTVSWGLYRPVDQSTPERHDIVVTTELKRFSMLFNIYDQPVKVIPLLYGNMSGVSGVTMHVERLMLERQVAKNTAPSVWVAGTTDIGSQINATVTTLSKAYSDADRALSTRIDQLSASFTGEDIGGANLWSPLDTKGYWNETGEGIKTDINPDTEHYKVVISYFDGNGKVMNSFQGVYVDPLDTIDVGDKFVFSFEIKASKKLSAGLVVNMANYGVISQYVETDLSWKRYSFMITANATSTTGIEQAFGFSFHTSNGWSVNDWYEVKHVQMQRGTRGTDFHKAGKALSKRIAETSADITTHKETYASDKESTSTYLDKMVSTFKSTAGSLIPDYEMKFSDEWEHHYPDRNINDNFITIENGAVGTTAYWKPANTGYDYSVVYNKTVLAGDSPYLVEFFVKKDVGSTGRDYVVIGRKTGTARIIEQGSFEVTNQIPADGQWHKVTAQITQGIYGSHPLIYMGFAINHLNPTHNAWLQGFKVTKVLTSKDVDGSIASTASVTDLRDTLTQADIAFANRTQAVEASLSNVDAKAEMLRTNKPAEINLKDYSEDLWYPVGIGPISSVTRSRLSIYKDLIDADKPTWSRHYFGFSLELTWTSNGSGWGVANVYREIEAFNHNWTVESVPPIIRVNQIGTTSREIIWLRGGAFYSASIPKESIIHLPNLETGIQTDGNGSFEPMSYTLEYLPEVSVVKAQQKADATSAVLVTTNAEVSRINGELVSKSEQLTNLSSTVNSNQANLINNYFTKTDTNNVISGELTTFKSTLKIGASNLVKNSSFNKDLKGWASNGGTQEIVLDNTSPNGMSHCLKLVGTGYGNGVYSGFTRSLPVGEECTASVWAKGEVGGEQLMLMLEGHSSMLDITLTTEWKRYSHTSKPTRADQSATLYMRSGGTMFLSCMQYERGNILTDWSESTFDVNASLTANAEAVTTTNAEVARINGEVVATSQSLLNLSGQVGSNQANLVNNYYTKTDADAATTGRLTTFKAQLNMGGVNLLHDYAMQGKNDAWKNNGGGYSLVDDSTYGKVIQTVVGAGIIHLPVPVESDNTYTFTVRIKSSLPFYNFEMTPLHWWAGNDTVANDRDRFAEYVSSKPAVTVLLPADTWHTISVTVKVKNGCTNFTPFIYEGMGGATVQIARAQFEKGDFFTDWNKGVIETQRELQEKASATVLESTIADVSRINGQTISNTSRLSNMESTVSGQTTAIANVNSLATTNASSISTVSNRIDNVSSEFGSYKGSNDSNVSSIRQLAETNSNSISSQGSLINGLQSSTNTLASKLSDTTYLTSLLAQGRLVSADPEFRKGYDGLTVYNNGSGNITLERISRTAGNPSQSDYQIRLRAASSTASPGLGGFYSNVIGRANEVFIQKIVMKIPVGYSISAAANYLGPGGATRFYGSVEGTGTFSTYFLVVNYGPVEESGNEYYSTAGHTYFLGPTPSEEGPLLVDVASIALYNCTGMLSDSALDAFIAEATSKLDTLTNANSAVATDVTTLKAIQGKRRTYRVQSYSNGNAGNGRLLDAITDQILVQGVRSYSLVVFNPDSSIRGSWNYDVYGNGEAAGGNNAEALRTALDSGLQVGEYFVIFTSDEPSSNRHVFRELILDCGGSAAAFDSIGNHFSYLLVGRKGIGEGQGIELVSKDRTTPVEYMLEVVNGVPLGLSGSANLANIVKSNTASINVVDNRVTSVANDILNITTRVANNESNLVNNYATKANVSEATSNATQALKATLGSTILPTDRAEVNTWFYRSFLRKGTAVSGTHIPSYLDIADATVTDEGYLADGNTNLPGAFNNRMVLFRAIIYSDIEKNLTFTGFTGDDAHAIYVNSTKVFEASGYSTNPVSFPIPAGQSIIDIMVNDGTGAGGFTASPSIPSQVVSLWAARSNSASNIATATALRETQTTVTNIDGKVNTTASDVLTLKSTVSALEELTVNNKTVTIDLSNPKWGQDTWYPVGIGGIPTSTPTTSIIYSVLDGRSKPKWSTHGAGFQTQFVWEATGAGWGASIINRRILNHTWSWVADYSPILSVDQFSTSSREIVWLRGGGMYYASIYKHAEIFYPADDGVLTNIHGETIGSRLYDANLVPLAESNKLANTGAALQVTNQVIDGVRAVSTVAVDINGVYSGYGLISEIVSGQVKSGFGINADQFYIGAPSSGKKPFIVLTSPGTVNGVANVPAGTYIDTAYIADATITSAKISTLDATKITTGTLSADRIAAKSLSVDKLVIGDGSNLWSNRYGDDGGSQFSNGNLSRMGYVPELRGKGWTLRGRDHYAEWGSRIPLVLGDTFVIEYTAGYHAGSASIGAGMWVCGHDGSFGNTPYQYTPSTVIKELGQGWFRLRSTVTIRDNGAVGGPAFGRLYFQIEQNETGGATQKSVGDIEVRKSVDNALIVTGGISADKLSADAISAISVQARTYTAYQDPANPYGARTVVSGGLTEVYDNNNVLRVRLGVW